MNPTLQSAIAELRSEHPWIPGAVFTHHEGLAEALVDAIVAWDYKQSVAAHPSAHIVVPTPLSEADAESIRERFRNGTFSHDPQVVVIPQKEPSPDAIIASFCDNCGNNIWWSRVDSRWYHSVPPTNGSHVPVPPASEAHKTPPHIRVGQPSSEDGYRDDGLSATMRKAIKDAEQSAMPEVREQQRQIE